MTNWVENADLEEPKKNLSKGALIGRKWVLENVQKKVIFITKADKGGAILILDYSDVISTLEKEIFNVEKYRKVEGVASEAHLKNTSDKVKQLSLKLQKEQKISPSDVTLITGINKKGNMSKKTEYLPAHPAPNNLSIIQTTQT